MNKIKLIIRIIIVIPMFVIAVVGMYTVIPIGLLVLIMGLGDKIYQWLVGGYDTTEWSFVFSGIMFPYWEAKKFIYGDNKSKS